MTAPQQDAVWPTRSADETFAVGEALGRCLVGGLVIGLVGPLGAGKTRLVKGLATGNAPARISSVTSPTFTLIQEYPGRLSLYHVDAYRLGGAAELLALGFDELGRADSAVVVEWADRVRPAMPQDTLWITLTITGPTNRSLAFAPGGRRARRCLDALQAGDKIPT